MYKTLAFLILPLLLTLGCQKDEGPGPGFDLVYRRTFEIPAGIGIFDVHHFYLKNIPSRYLESLAQSSRTDDQINGIVTLEGSLSGQFGDANLDFIDRISVRVYSEDDETDFLEIAYRDPTPFDIGNFLGLIPSLSSSKRFFSEERVNIDVALWLRNTTTDNWPVQLDLRMRATYQ